MTDFVIKLLTSFAFGVIGGFVAFIAFGMLFGFIKVKITFDDDE